MQSTQHVHSLPTFSDYKRSMQRFEWKCYAKKRENTQKNKTKKKIKEKVNKKKTVCG